MDPGQDWCLQCGAGAPGSLDAGGPSWRSAAAILTATAVLVLGAAAAAYAALNKEGAHKVTPDGCRRRDHSRRGDAHADDAGHAHADDAWSGDAHPESLRHAAAANPLLSTGTAKPPKIPLTAPTPKSSRHDHHAREHQQTNRAPRQPRRRRATNPPAKPRPNRSPRAIVLDPDAATTYNPYGYPASEFGDPSLAIDGDTSTEWTAQVNPAMAPKMAEGLRSI